MDVEGKHPDSRIASLTIAGKWVNVLTQRQDKTRQEPHGKQVTLVAFDNYKKVPYRFWRDQQLSERDGSLQCSAGPERYGYHSINDTLASMWAPAVGRPSESAGCSTQKKTRERNNCGSHPERRLQTEALHAKLEIECSIEKRVTGRTRVH